MRMLRTAMTFALVSIAGLETPTGAAQPSGEAYLVYFGTYTRTASKGIYAYRFQPSTGQLTSLGLAAETLHPSFVAAHPNGRFLNKVSSRGEGPCHISVDETGRTLLVANFRVNGETDSTVSALAYNARTGTLKGFQTMSTLPAGFSGTNTAAEIQVDRAGRFLYVSNRGHNIIAIFAIDQASGALTSVEHVPTNGSTPRYFTFDPTGAYLLAGNQGSDTVVVYRVDAKTGRLTPMQTLADVPEPACIVFVSVKR